MIIERDAPFEGAEKRLEITLDPGTSLRCYDLGFWRRFLEKIPVKILSSVSNESCNAHLLSESSLFVFDRRLILMTCGRTNLIPTAVELLHFFGIQRVRSLLYEREEEGFPERQPSCFAQDVDRLQSCGSGETLRVEVGQCRIDCFRLLRRKKEMDQNDRLKLILHGLRAGLRFGAQKVSLQKIFLDFQIDEHQFEPAGYSLNAIRGDRYYTLHISPNEPGSYASFETNLGLTPQTRRGFEALFETLRPQEAALLLENPLQISLFPVREGAAGPFGLVPQPDRPYPDAHQP